MNNYYTMAGLTEAVCAADLEDDAAEAAVPEERGASWAGHARPEIRNALRIRDVIAPLLDRATPLDAVADITNVVLDQALLGFNRNPRCACDGFRESIFYGALEDARHPALAGWSPDGCEHRGNDPSSPPLAALRRGALADAVLAVAARGDACAARHAPGLYVAYACALLPAMVHHGAHANFSKMVRVALFADGSGGPGAIRAIAALEALEVALAEARPIDYDARDLFLYAQDVAAAVPDACLDLPRAYHCDACGRRRSAMRRCANCRHVRYCDAECQDAAWRRDFVPHRKVCADLRKLTLRAEKAGFAPALDKMICAVCDFGPTTPDMLRWHCTLTQHRRWPETDLLTYAPEPPRGDE